MNIVPTTPSAPTSTAVKPDGPTTGHIVSTAVDGVDVPPAGNGTTSTTGFGSMLARHLDDARGDDAKGATIERARVGLDPKAVSTDAASDHAISDAAGAPTTDADAPAVDAKSGVGVVVPQDLFPSLATPATTASGMATNGTQGSRDGTTRKGKLDDDRKQDGDAGSDRSARGIRLQRRHNVNKVSMNYRQNNTK